MQLVINYPLVKRRARLGKLATLIGVGALAVGFLMSLRMSAPGERVDVNVITVSYGAMIVALVTLSFGRNQIARWSRRPRADEVLAEALKGLDARYYLLSYLPELPVDHLLITPHGLLVVIVRSIVGDIRNTGHRWGRKFAIGQLFGGYSDGGLGNPSDDARRGVAAIQARLSSLLGSTSAEEVPVAATIVFTDRRANLRIEKPVVPVVAPDDLRNQARTLLPDTKLPREAVDQILKAFVPDRTQFERVSKKEAPARRKRGRRPAPATDVAKVGRNRAERRMR